MKQVLLWDFSGPNSRPTAEHFERHLKQFLERSSVVAPTALISERPDHVGVVCLCDAKDAALVGAALKPQGQCDGEAFETVHPGLFV